MTTARISALTAASLTAFAANSLLTRGALAAGRIDPASFLAIRITAGAMALWLLTRRHRAGVSNDDPANHWTATFALIGYAVAFTFAYVRIGAGMGALALFGAVQTTMIGVGLRAGERPGRAEVAGLLVALAGLLTLTVPGATRPPLVGVVLMVVAGTCWGAYSLQGRRSRDPLIGTAHNFMRAVPVVLAVLVWQRAGVSVTPMGVTFAAISGAVTSGVGYAIWYSVLPQLTAWRAALVQLLTPVLTAIAAVVILGESMSPRLWISGALIVSGVVVSLGARARRHA